jgi:hypothetical protein
MAALLLLAGPASAAEAVFVGAGDIAMCNFNNDEKTAVLLDKVIAETPAGTPLSVFTIGDNAYPDGTAQDFEKCYEPSWGRHKARTRPGIGNHEYNAEGANPYLDYFKVQKNYSFELGDWHIVSLDSMCQLEENGGSCARNSPAMKWLEGELQLNAEKKCTLVYFHHPRWSSGHQGNTLRMRGAWKIMYENGVDVVLSGHDHNYERFKPLNPDGKVDWQKGIRSFVVGTGGGVLGVYFPNPQPGSEVRNAVTHGVLKLTLRADRFDWEFIPVEGRTFKDSGSGKCH